MLDTLLLVALATTPVAVFALVWFALDNWRRRGGIRYERRVW